MPLCFWSEFFLSFFAALCLCDNLKTPAVIVFKIMSAINDGHGNIPVIIQQDPELFKGGCLSKLCLLCYMYIV